MYTFCSGTISIADSFFEGMGDDGLNIYTKYRTVTRVTGSNRIEAVMGNATWRGPTPEPGEVIVFQGGDDLKDRGSATVKSAAWDPRAAVFTVEFSQALPAGIATNDLILCPAYLPRARVLRCTFRGMRARAMLFSTYDVQVEHCRIEAPTHAGIMLLGGRRHNFQGPAPRDVVIRDCDFIGCGGAAIYAYGSVTNPGWDVLRDVTIADNRIREDPRLFALRFKKDHPDWAHWSSALCLKNVDGAVIRGNTIDGYATAVFLDNDRNVVVAENVCTNAATVVFDADRTSGVSLTGNRGLTPAATARQFDSDLQYINDLR